MRTLYGMYEKELNTNFYSAPLRTPSPRRPPERDQQARGREGGIQVEAEAQASDRGCVAVDAVIQ